MADFFLSELSNLQDFQVLIERQLTQLNLLLHLDRYRLILEVVLLISNLRLITTSLVQQDTNLKNNFRLLPDLNKIKNYYTKKRGIKNYGFTFTFNRTRLGSVTTNFDLFNFGYYC